MQIKETMQEHWSHKSMSYCIWHILWCPYFPRGKRVAELFLSFVPLQWGTSAVDFFRITHNFYWADRLHGQSTSVHVVYMRLEFISTVFLKCNKMQHSHLSGDLYYVECCDLKRRSAVILCSTTQLAEATMDRYLEEIHWYFQQGWKRVLPHQGSDSSAWKALLYIPQPSGKSSLL